MVTNTEICRRRMANLGGPPAGSGAVNLLENFAVGTHVVWNKACPRTKRRDAKLHNEELAEKLGAGKVIKVAKGYNSDFGSVRVQWWESQVDVGQPEGVHRHTIGEGGIFELCRADGKNGWLGPEKGEDPSVSSVISQSSSHLSSIFVNDGAECIGAAWNFGVLLHREDIKPPFPSRYKARACSLKAEAVGGDDIVLNNIHR
jgi:hypothetical protein